MRSDVTHSSSFAGISRQGRLSSGIYTSTRSRHQQIAAFVTPTSRQGISRRVRLRVTDKLRYGLLLSLYCSVFIRESLISPTPSPSDRNATTKGANKVGIALRGIGHAGANTGRPMHQLTRFSLALCWSATRTHKVREMFVSGCKNNL